LYLIPVSLIDQIISKIVKYGDVLKNENVEGKYAKIYRIRCNFYLRKIMEKKKRDNELSIQLLIFNIKYHKNV
jgi:hypothetical protein